MFDDNANSPAGAPPSNLPSEPVDMFAGVEKADSTPPAMGVPAAPNALDAGKLQPKVAAPPVVRSMPDLEQSSASSAVPPAVSTYEVKGPILGKIILFVVAAVALGGLGFGGWWAYMRYFVAVPASNTPPANTAPVVDNTQPILPVEQPPLDETAVSDTLSEGTDLSGGVSATSDLSTEINSDKILFGNQVDSDRDGLDDARETELGTDINNSDTDSDGLSDYDEVATWKTNPLNPDTDGDTYVDGQEVRALYNPLGQGKLQLPTPTTTP